MRQFRYLLSVRASASNKTWASEEAKSLESKLRQAAMPTNKFIIKNLAACVL